MTHHGPRGKRREGIRLGRYITPPASCRQRERERQTDTCILPVCGAIVKTSHFGGGSDIARLKQFLHQPELILGVKGVDKDRVTVSMQLKIVISPLLTNVNDHAD